MAPHPAADRKKNVVVELAGSIRSTNWEVRHGRGEVADLSPYGLHRLSELGANVWFRNSSEHPWRSRLDGFVLHRTKLAWAQTLVPSRRAPWKPDVLLAWSERGGIPAIAREEVTGRRTPVVTGVIWETEKASRAGRLWLPRAAAVFVLSTGQIAATNLLVGGRVPQVHYVPFGIDTDFFNMDGAEEAVPMPTDIDHLFARHSVVVSVGNDASRDHATLTGAMSQVQSAAGTTPSVRLLLASRTPAAVPIDMGLQVQHLDASQLRSTLRRASVFAVATRPNLHVSGVTAVLEAMSVGLPVVASRTPGMHDYVRHGETGLLVECGDVDGLATAVQGLLADPDWARSLGEAAAHHVRVHHDVASMQRTLAPLIDLPHRM